MQTNIAISYFKSHCLEIIEQLHNNQAQSIIITKRDKPIAKLTSFDTPKTSLFGLLKGSGEIKGDIIAPIGDEWDACNVKSLSV